jgi:hypothetical protein
VKKFWEKIAGKKASVAKSIIHLIQCSKIFGLGIQQKEISDEGCSTGETF